MQPIKFQDCKGLVKKILQPQNGMNMISNLVKH